MLWSLTCENWKICCCSFYSSSCLRARKDGHHHKDPKEERPIPKQNHRAHNLSLKNSTNHKFRFNHSKCNSFSFVSVQKQYSNLFFLIPLESLAFPIYHFLSCKDCLFICKSICFRPFSLYPDRYIYILFYFILLCSWKKPQIIYT